MSEELKRFESLASDLVRSSKEPQVNLPKLTQSDIE